MTANQIAYWNLQETKRSNLARETETHRHNVRDEDITKEHNDAQEVIGAINAGVNLASAAFGSVSRGSKLPI